MCGLDSVLLITWITHAAADDYFPEDVADEEDETELEGVETLTGGRGFALKIAVPAAFYKYIIGRQGATKISIERETKTKIRVPQRGAHGDISKCISTYSTYTWTMKACTV